MVQVEVHGFKAYLQGGLSPGASAIAPSSSLSLPDDPEN